MENNGYCKTVAIHKSFWPQLSGSTAKTESQTGLRLLPKVWNSREQLDAEDVLTSSHNSHISI